MYVVMEFYTGYKEAEVVECGKALAGLQLKVKESKLQTVVRKCSSSLKGSVRCFGFSGQVSGTGLSRW
ncbi:hypothetical protein LINGRAHAP2_LOCUS7625 [Linum grandiflorum]